MPSTFLGIEIGQRALAASQVAQDTVGHNIANAGTPGYSEQSVDLQATDPFTPPDQADRVHAGMIGTGVVASSITRARDQFLDVELRDGTSTQSTQTAQQNALTQIESAFGEPSNTGLANAMDTFFQNFNELSNNPEDLGIRATTIQSGVAMTNVFQDIQQRLTTIGAQLNSKVGVDMDTLNSYGKQIAALNVTIRQATAQNQVPNDLMDQRDVLIDKLSALANVTVTNKPDGTTNVSVGTSDLVVGTDSYTLSLNGPGSLNDRGDLKQGELAGLAQAQTDLTGYQKNLDDLAGTMVAQVNAQHQQGYDLNGNAGGNFFDPAKTTAGTIAVDPTLLNDPKLLAASAAAPVPPATSTPGDAGNAVKLAALENLPTTIGTAVNVSMQAFYQQTVSDVGGKSAAAKTAANSATVNVSQLSQQRNSISGVSTDTEMVNMLKYQRAYQAAARVVQTMDSMVGTLITDLFANR